MVLQVRERLVQWRMVVLAISNPLHEGLPVVSPSAEFTVSEAELLRTGPVEPLSADSLARLWSGFSPVAGGVPSDLAQGCILSPSATLRMHLSKGHLSS